MSKNKKLVFIGFSFGAVLIIAGVLFVLNSTQVLSFVGIKENPPIFVFNKEKASGWWAADNYNSRASVDDSYKGDTPAEKLPVASMHVFMGEEGDGRTNCFVSFSYYDFKTDIAKLKAEKDASSQDGDLRVRAIGETAAVLATAAGEKAYHLTNYELSGAGTENAMRGMSYGWIELDEGYVQVAGVCPTAAELGNISEASGAIKLETETN